MHGSRQNRTFTAISFQPADSRPESVDSISFVHYKSGRVHKDGTLPFMPLKGGDGKNGQRAAFEKVFERIRPFVAALNVPVLVWDDRAIEIFNTLLIQSACGIVMKGFPRYFKVRDYAVYNIGKVARGWDWKRIVKHFMLNTAATVEPEADQIAALMLQIEGASHFPVLVAKAFCRFCDSILEDRIVTINEARELRSFVSLISDKYPEFKKLECELDDVLEDDKVTAAESRRLVRILNGMLKYYKRFVKDVAAL